MPKPLLIRQWLLATRILSVLLLSYFSLEAKAQGNVPDAVEVEALRDFYLATDGDHWTNHTGWPSSSEWNDPKRPAFTSLDFKNWYGINVTWGDVYYLSLPSNNLVGQLPASLTDLTSIWNLQLSGNALTGSLPDNLERFQGIAYFDLSNNQFSGSIPASIGQMSPAYGIKINNNQLSGTIPASIENLKECATLDVSYNKLRGTIPIAIGSMSQLTYCYLSHNQFSGVVPEQVFNASFLSTFDASDNFLEGELPSKITSLKHINALRFSRNKLTGIPNWQAAGVTRVPGIDVNENYLDFGAIEPNFSGPKQPVPYPFSYFFQINPTPPEAVIFSQGETLTSSQPMGGERNHYQWQKLVNEGLATEEWQDLVHPDSPTLSIAHAGAANEGSYRARITNDWVKHDFTSLNMVLYTRIVKATMVTSLSWCPPLVIKASSDVRIAAGASTTLQATVTVAGNALQFDGIKDQVNFPQPASEGVNTFTVEAWVLPTAVHEVDAQQSSGTSGATGQRYLLHPVDGAAQWGANHAGLGISVGTNGISIYARSGAETPALLVWESPTPLTAWTHLAVVCNQGTPSLYVNGKLAATGLASLKQLHLSPVLGGGDYGYYSGRVDELRWWNVALAPVQISTGYSQLLQQATEGLVGYYRFDESAGTVVSDLVGKASVGSFSAASLPQWVASAVPFATPAIRWSPATSLSAATGTRVTARPTSTTSYIASASVGQNCAEAQAGLVVQVVPVDDMPPANADPDLTKNWSLVRSFSGEDQLIGETKHFADGLGRGTQAQVKSLSQGHVLATQTVYSSDGKPVLSTLAAPTFNQEFKFKNGFLQPASSTTDYNYANFETDPNSPSAVAATSKGTVGYYYGPANELEPQTATTQYPFSLQQEYSGPLGGVKRSAGPGDAFRIGSGHELRSRSFPLLNELEHYLSLRPHFVDATSATTALYNHGVKQVSVNPDGIESIAFADQDGKLLASCLSGKDYPGLTLRFALDANTQNTNGLPPYQDIHIPAAGDAVVTVGGTGSIQIIDLVTEAVTTYPTGTATALPASISLVPGFYRVVSISGQQQLSYLAHYGDFSYSYYDNAGRGVASVASRGVVLASTAYPSFVTRNTYSGAGTLLSTESTDEGRTEYVYARDGRIRFSQSAVQHDKGRFSYSNYDELGRVVESGEYTMSADGLAGFVFESQLTETPRTNSVLTLLEDRTRTGGLDVGRCQQRNEIWYDLADETLAGPAQEFVLGAVAKTRNETNVTWYSYDELGRITRMVQQAGGLGKKTVEYTYDFTGNVLKVAYQKEQPDAFYHYYEYDKDQRLNRVYTSRNDLTRTLQAQYYYYLHGSLKRVELAGRLQGIDYAYTVQGWLKSINNVEKRLDPGQDNLKANGVLKDLFGLRLDYFNGDYSSRQLTAPNLATPANSSNIRYDGTVRASTWQTAAAPTIHGYTYAYDAKGQLLQSTYGQLAANTLSQLPQFAEGNLSYDAHGNIERLVRTNDKGTVSDNFKYQYLAGTNKLQAVNTPEGAKVLSYDYDLNGQMKWEAEEGKGTKYMRYDVTGKVSGVYRNADLTNPIATYAYDDRGFRNSKVAYNASGVVQNTTYYVTDAAGNVLSVYEQAPGKELQLAEIPLYGSSRLGTITRLDDEAGTLEPRYELNDQLGNARVVFRKPTSTKYLATVNANLATEEEKDFENLPATRYADIARAYDGAHVAALFTPGQGPKKTLTVEKGDTITFSAQALYYSPTGGRASATASNGLRIMPLITSGATLAPLPGQSTTPGTERSSTKPSFLSRLSFGISLTMFGGKEQPLPNSTTGAPEILIRYRFYNSNNELKAQGVEPFSGSPEAWQKLELGFRAPEAGRIELTTENIGLDYTCYFDHIEVDHTNSTIVQEQHQYAFGSPLTGLNYVVGNKRYRHGYQGQYAEQDEETGYDSFELRLYNSRIGRWTAPDPYGQFFSPYVGMGNDPINSVDTNGGFSGPGDPSHIVGNLLGEVHVTHYASMAPNIVSAMQGSVSAWMATQPPTTLPAYVTAPTSGWAPGTWPPRPAGMSPDGIEPVFWEHNFMPGPPIGRLAERGLSLGVAALERAALRRASRALVPMAEETFEQALFKGVEYIGKVEVYGTKGLVGETFNRNIFYLKSAQPSFGGVRSLLGAMEKEAVEAGAKKISIYGASVINSKIINPKLAAALGYTLEESGQGVILQKVLKP